MKRWILASCLAIAACGPSTPPPQAPPGANVAAPSGGATCDTAAGHLIDIMSASKQEAPPPPDAVKKLHDVLVAHCQNDAWSPQLLQCLTDMKAVADSERCEAMMTPAQNDALNKERGPDQNAPGAEPAATSPAPPAPPPSTRSAQPKKSGDPCDGGN